MSKFAMLVNEDGYKKYTYLTAKSAGASVPVIKAGIIKKVFEIHNSEPLNRYFELPFKAVWFHKVVDESKLDKDEEVIFVLYESFHMSYSRKLIRHFKRKYNKSKFVFFFTNPAGEYNLRRLSKIQDLLDTVFTFNSEDAEKYGFSILKEEPFLLPKQDSYSEETDLFFIGADKGRLPILLSVFEKLSKEGFICDFWITGVPENKQEYKEYIHYNQRLTYEEVLQHDAHTRCIVEILQDSKSYSSIRTAEALQYRKKLLTMSETVKEQWFYKPEIIQVFRNADGISTDFIRHEVDDKSYEDINLGTFERFEMLILEALNSREN